MSNLQPQEAWTYQDKETLKLTQLVYDSINRVGIKTVLERVMFKLSPYKNEYKNSKSRVEECLNHINIEGSIEGTYDNDVARALVWCLKKGPNEKKNNKNFRDPIIVSTKEKKLSNDILEHNTISYNESRQYDPKKNGMNYLKHGLFFDDVMSYCVGEFGRLLTHSNHRGEDRQVVFSRYRKNDIDQHTVSIVIYSPIDKLSETSAEVHEKAAKLALSTFPDMFEDNGVTFKTGIDLVQLLPVLMEFNDIKQLISDTKPMRFITSWIFDQSNFCSTVVNRIEDENLADDIVEELKERSVEILSKAWEIEIK